MGRVRLAACPTACCAVLDRLDARLPIRIANDPTVVDRRFVPRQGSGMGPLAAGTPTFRAFVRDKLCRIEPRQWTKKICLTREEYRLQRGGVFAETHLRKLLENAGYVAFAPERHSFDEQVATYRGASHIIGPDSSALHLVAYVAEPDTKVAILLRRHDRARDLLPQLAGHLGRKPLVVNAISQILRRNNQPNANWSLFADLDFRAIYFALRQAGFIRGRPARADLSESERADLLVSYVTSLNCSLKVIWQRATVDAPKLPTGND